MQRVIWITLILLLAACSRKAGNQVIIPDEPPSEVIDHPAVVVYAHGNKSMIREKTDAVNAARLISELQIPVITTKNKNLEFVKRNGDRITLNISRLPEKYDIILFNSINNPLPCSSSDLPEAARNIFTKPQQRAPQKPVKDKELQLSPLPVGTDDTIKLPAKRQPALKKPGPKMRKFTLAVPDTTSADFRPREVPGIVFIENRVDMRTIFRLNFENDLITWNNTDRYFTNGVTLELQSPRWNQLAVARLMLPYRYNACSSASLVLVQNMYTSADTRIPPALINDRPFASYIYIGIKKVSSDYSRRFRLSSSLYSGIIGPYSAGSFFQTLVHKTFPTNDIPQGWDTQIHNDVILNYDIQLEKGLVESGLFSMSVLAGIQTGTLYSNAGGGIYARFGISDPLSGSPEKSGKAPWQAYLFFRGEGRIIGYDATLQGGLINRDNIYTLPGSQIKRLTGRAGFGLHVSYKGFGLEATQHFLTPEFNKGLAHRWGRLSLIFPL